MLHLAERSRALGSETEHRLAQAREWLFWEANRIGISLANIRSMLRFEPAHDPGALEWLRHSFQRDAERLDAELSTKPFLLGDAVTIADISCSAYLFYAHEAGIDPAMWPNIQRWLDRITALPGFALPTELMRRR
ncbi:MAG TPA: glutathione binding-like protein [Polyangiaceae bacterium]|nr:glutathione binding-like protein [Polyangiaceae bacterium]